MNRDLTPSRYSALVVPFDADVWPDHTTITQAGPRAGVPVPVDGEGASRMALGARGTQTADVQVRSQRGGFATRDAEESGAAFVWRDATTSGSTTTYGAWRGWDPPRNVTRFDAPIVAESAAGTIRYAKKPSAVVCADGTVLMAVEVRDTSAASPYQIAIWRRSTASDSWTRVTSPYGQTSAPTWDLCPCLVALDSGRVVLYYVLYDSVLAAGAISAWYSDDYGTTWSFVSDGLADSNPGAAITSLTAAQKDGVILLNAFTSGTGDIYQFASTDFGNSLVQVEQWNPTNAILAVATTATPSGFLVVVNGGAAATGTYAYRLGDAFQRLSASTAVTIRAGSSFTPYVGVGCDEAGVLYAYVFQTTFLDPYYSFDDGASWQGYQGPAYTYDYAGTATFSLDSYCVVPVRGQVLVIGSYAASSTTYAGIRVWTLGGYSTVTMPRYGRTFLPKALQGWPGTWHPVNLPERMSWTRTATPPATIASIATGALVITTAVTQEWYSQTPTTTNAVGMMARFVLEVSAGAAFGDGLSALLRLDDTVNRFGARLQWTTTQWQLVDDVSGATIGTAQNYSGRVEILVAINVPAATAATAGTVRTWSRRVDVTSQSGVREFAAGPSSTTLSRAASLGATQNRIQWGHRANGTYTSTWYEVAWSYGSTSINVNLSQGQTSPDDLFARPYASSGSGAYVGSGVTIEAKGGPTWLGESWDIERRYDYGIERALTFPSPRHTWVATTNSEIVALLWATSGANNYTSKGLVAIYLGNCNAETVAISYRNVAGASWTSLGTADRCVGLTSLAFDQRDASVKPTTDAGIYLRANEFAGSWFVDTTGALQRQIASHPEGRWSSSAPLRTSLLLTSSLGTTTGRTNGKIVPKDTVILVDLSSIDTPAIRLTLAKSSTTDAVQCGVLRIGKVVGLGTRYDWGRTIDLDLAGTEVAEARDRTTRSTVAAPSRRTVSIAWADTAIDQTDVDRNGDPDYLLGAGQAIAGVQSTAYTIEGVARELDGADTPVVYLPSVAPMVGSLAVLNRRHQLVYGRVASDISIENVLGEEGDSELVRVATMAIREEV